MGEADTQAETEVDRQIEKRLWYRIQKIESIYFFSSPFHISLFFRLKCEIYRITC